MQINTKTFQRGGEELKTEDAEFLKILSDFLRVLRALLPSALNAPESESESEPEFVFNF